MWIFSFKTDAANMVLFCFFPKTLYLMLLELLSETVNIYNAGIAIYASSEDVPMQKEPISRINN